MAAGACNPDAGGRGSRVGGFVVADLQPSYRHIALVLDIDQSPDIGSGRCQSRAIQDRVFTRVVLECNWTGGRRTRNLDVDGFMVDTPADVNRLPCVDGIGRVLNASPGCVHSPRIGVIAASDCDVKDLRCCARIGRRRGAHARRSACGPGQALPRAPRKGSTRKSSVRGEKRNVTHRRQFMDSPSPCLQSSPGWRSVLGDGCESRPAWRLPSHRPVVDWDCALFKVTLQRGRALLLAPGEFIALDHTLQGP